jgi:hypothetical protein
MLHRWFEARVRQAQKLKEDAGGARMQGEQEAGGSLVRVAAPQQGLGPACPLALCICECLAEEDGLPRASACVSLGPCTHHAGASQHAAAAAAACLAKGATLGVWRVGEPLCHVGDTAEQQRSAVVEQGAAGCEGEHAIRCWPR